MLGRKYSNRYFMGEYGNSWGLIRFWLTLILHISYLLLWKNLPKTHWLNITINHLLSLTNNESQEFESGLTVWFWLGIPHEIIVRCHMGLQSSESLTRAGSSTFNMLMAVKLVLAVGGRPQFFYMWASPQCCLLSSQCGD